MRRPESAPTGPTGRRDLALHVRNVGIMVVGLAVILGGAAIHDALTADPTPARTVDAGPFGPDPVAEPTSEPTRQPTRTTGPTPTPRSVPTRPPDNQPDPRSGFLHPGLLVTRGQLDLVRQRVTHGAQPFTRALDRLKRSSYAKPDWQPHPRAVVDCGYFSIPDNGCSDERRDAIAAYTHALLWYVTLDEDYAESARTILNAWSGTIQDHTGPNAPLQAGWSAVMLARAAELLRYTYTGWTWRDTEQISHMFSKVYVPLLRDGAPRGSEGNWDLIILDGAISIAVFTDDRPLFDHVVNQWRARVPAYIYLAADGARPIGPPKGTSNLTGYWHGQTIYVDGLVQETCRDLQHTGWGLEAMTQIAEIAWIQGVDLYAEAQQRLVAALELHAGLALGDPPPAWLCGGVLTSSFRPIAEIAYNHYQGRLGVDMPRTAQLIERQRPQSASHFYGWETLTSVSAD